MKMRYLLPVFVLAGFVSLAGAKDCLVNGNKAYCKWDQCYAIDPTYATNPATATCQSEVDNCVTNSDPKGVYTDANCSGTKITTGYTVTESGLSDEICTGYYCNWDSCGDITTDRNGTYGKVISTCTEAIQNCVSNSPSNTVYSNATCSTPHSGVDQGENCNAWCMWDDCYKISPDDCSNNTGDCTPTYNCTEAIANCAANSSSRTAYSNSTCTNAISPILNTHSLAGLTVAPHGRALHISSPRDASVTLYDLSGNRVFGGKVRAGNSVFSLTSQAPGVYYAVVQSGSLTQKVNVVLK